jgi:putative chitinase
MIKVQSDTDIRIITVSKKDKDRIMGAAKDEAAKQSAKPDGGDTKAASLAALKELKKVKGASEKLKNLDTSESVNIVFVDSDTPDMFDVYVSGSDIDLEQEKPLEEDKPEEKNKNKNLSEKTKDVFSKMGSMFKRGKSDESASEEKNKLEEKEDDKGKEKKELFTTLSSEQVSPLRKGETASNIAAKIYSLVKREGKEEKKEHKKELRESKEEEGLKKTRHKEIVDALLGKGKFKSKIKEPKLEAPKAKKPAAGKPPAPAPAPAPKPGKPPAPAPAPAPAPKPGKPPAPTPAPAPAAKPAKPAEKPPTKAPEAKPAEKPPAKAPEAKPKAEPTKPVEAKPKVEPAVKPGPAISKAAKVGVLAASGVAGVLASGLAEAGISETGQANILAQVKAETGFKLKSEDLYYKSAKGIFATFGPPRIPNEEFAQQFVKNPEALANHVYAKTDGNSEPGDGWKYRGRGYIQHTGKNQYKAIAKYTGVDVISNPDLLNEPSVATKALAWFFLDYKKLKPEDLDDIKKVNKAVGFKEKKDKSGKLESAKREEEALKFLQPSGSSSGDKIAMASTENKDMKKQIDTKTQSPVIVNNNNTNVGIDSSKTVMVQKQDDASPYVNRNRA